MKILIVSRYFAPDNTVGAIRWTKYAKYLTRLGHDVTVYAMEPWTKIRDPILERDAQEIKRIFRIGHGRFYRAVHDFLAKRDPTAGTGKVEIRRSMEAKDPGGAPARGNGLSAALGKKLLSFAYHVMQVWAERDFVRAYRRFTAEDDRTYDAVIGTWSTDSSLLTALDVKRRGKAKRFVADFRDVCSSSWPELTGNRDVKRLLKRVYASADLVLSTCEQVHRANALHVPAHPRTRILTNGFDPEDLKGIDPQPEDGRFHIVYTGQIYPELQDFKDLFGVIRTLIGKNVIGRDELRVDYLGQSFVALHEQADSCGLADIVVNHGFVTRNTALSFELSADVLLLVTWNSDAFPAFPAKLLEYMLAGSPVLALITDNAPDFIPAVVMRETRLGFTHDNGDADSAARLEAWLGERVAAWRNGKDEKRKAGSAAASYAYPELAKRLAGLLEEPDREP